MLYNKYLTEEDLQKISDYIISKGKKITDFIQTDTLSGGEYFGLARDGKDYKVSAELIKELLSGGPYDLDVSYDNPDNLPSPPSDINKAFLIGQFVYVWNGTGYNKNPFKGNGIKSAVTTYQIGDSGSLAPTGNWTLNVPEGKNGSFLWSRLVITDTYDNIISTTYSVSRDGITYYSHYAYANSADGSVDFSQTDSDGKEYLGFYTDTINNGSDDHTKYKWIKFKGESVLTNADDVMRNIQDELQKEIDQNTTDIGNNGQTIISQGTKIEQTNQSITTLAGQVSVIDGKVTTNGTAIEQTATSIGTLAKRVTSTENGIAEAKSSILQNSDSIQTKVEKKTYDDNNDVIDQKFSQVIQTVNGVSIDVQSVSNATSNAQKSADDAAKAAQASQTDATNAINTLNDITSDNILSANEKPVERKAWNVILAELSNIDNQADKFGIARTYYDNSFQALATYLNGGTAYVAGIPLWLNDTNISVNTPIVGSDYRSYWETYYTQRTTLLNEIAARAKELANTAQTAADAANEAASNAQKTADDASSNASSALVTIGNIISDNVLSANEKPAERKEWNIVYAEKPVIDAQAVHYNTSSSDYDTAFTALATYLNGGTAYTDGIPEWLSDNDINADTAIQGSEYRSKWSDYFSARTAILNAITAQAKAIAESTAALDATSKADNALSDAKKYVNDNFVTAALHNQDLKSLQSQIDGQIETWFMSGVPTLANLPASGWTTDTDKVNHLGDLYYDTDTTTNETKKAYRFACVDSVYKWIVITDTDVTAALANAAKAQDTADQKRRIFVITPTPPYDGGDFWSQGSTGDIMRCCRQKFAGESYSPDDWEPASKYTDDTAANIAKTAADAAQTTADAAQADATSAIGTLSNITSDNVLSSAEKSNERKNWNTISSEKSDIDAKAVEFKISSTDYDNAFQTLANYLNGGTTWTSGIPLWINDNNLSSDTTIIGSDYRTNWVNLYTERTLLLNSISVKAKSLAESAQSSADNAEKNAETAQKSANDASTAALNAQGTANTAINSIKDISSDNILSASEKQSQLSLWNDALNEKSSIDSEAAKFSVSSVDYDNSFQSLADYLNESSWTSGTPVMLSDLTVNTSITGSVYRSKWNSYYSNKVLILNAISSAAKVLADTAQKSADNAKTAADNAQETANTAATNVANAQTDASSALSKITDIISDNILSASEKPSERKEWNIVASEKSSIDTNADTFSISRTDYDNAFQNLATYLNNGTVYSSGVPSWLSDSNISSDTVIVGSDYRREWKNYYDQRTSLLNAISAKAKTLADSAQKSANTAETKAEAAQTTATSASNAAIAAQGTANIAIQNIDDISSDNVLSSSEKPSQLSLWNDIVNEKSSIDSNASTFQVSSSTYDSAFQSLANYLNNGNTWTAGIPAMLSNLTVNTSITGSDYRTKWNSYYSAKINILNSISVKAKELADAAQTKANSASDAASNAQNTANAAATAASNAQNTANIAIGTLDNITSDNILSPVEKSAQRKEWNTIASEKSNIDSQANDFSVSSSDYDTAFQTLATYLNNGTTWSTGVPSWLADGNLSVNTTIVGSDYRNNWVNFYTKRTLLLNAIATKAKYLADQAKETADTAVTNAKNAADAASAAQTDATSALNTLSNITSDNILSSSEKSTERKAWNTIQAEKSINDSQADSFLVSRTDYDNAFQSLATYLNNGTTWSSGIPLWLSDAQLSIDTTIVGSDYRQYWETYYTKRTTLLNAISTEAKAIADSKAATQDVSDAKAVAKSYTDTQFHALDGEISAKVSQTDFNSLGNRVGTAESTITQHSTDIASKVSQTDYNGNTVASLINQTSTTINIEASHINLTGAVTIGALDKSSVTASALGGATPYDVTTAVDNIQIGGRNLIPYTNQAKDWYANSATGNGASVAYTTFLGVTGATITVTQSNSSWGIFFSKNTIGRSLIKSNQIYTISFDCQSNITHNFNVTIQDCTATNALIHFGNINLVANTVTHIVLTATSTTVTTTGQVLYLGGFNVTGLIFTIANLKLESGNKATSWSPAPEDVDNSISIAQTSSQDNLAEKLGYSNYADMVSKAASGKTLMLGGYINAQLIQTNALAVGNVNGLQSLLDGKISTSLNNAPSTILNSNVTVTSLGAATPTDVSTAVNNIQVGGTNLMADVYNWNTWNGSYQYYNDSTYGKVVQITSSGEGIWKYLTKHNTTGNKYSWSVYLRSSEPVSVSVGPEDGGIQQVALTTTWQLFKNEGYTSNGTNNGNFHVYYSDTTVNVYVYHPKVEQGTKATSWSPAPEDVSAYTDSAAANGNAAYNQVNWQIVSANTDLNSMTITGKYLMEGVVSNSPVSSWLYLIVERAAYDANIQRIVQTVWHDTDATNQYTRTGYNGTWGSWVKIANATDVSTAQTSAQNYATTNCVKTDASNAPSTILNSNVTTTSIGAATPTDVTTAVNGIQIGGRNLALSSDIYINNGNISQYTALIRYTSAGNHSMQKIVSGKYYVISFDVSSDTTLLNAYISENLFMFQNVIITPGARNHFVIQGHNINTTDTGIIKSSSNGIYYFHADNFKIEDGNKATTYTPAPEDVDSSITTAQTSAQNYATTNCVKTDASNAPSTIKNSTVSIGNDGTLNNAGGGKVTIGGLGYTGALDATNGAPSGTYVGSTLAQTVESNASTALANAAKAQSTADGKITTFYQASAPTNGMSEGDIWFDIDDSNKIYIYQSGTWKLTRDSGIAQAINAASAAQTTANTGVSNAATAQTTANNAATAASNAQTSANTANSAIANIVSDNMLSANEKGGERDRWNVIASEKSGIDTQATTYEITTEKTAYDTAFQTLATYLNNGTAWSSGIPNWITDVNLSVNTTVDGTTYRSNWQGYFDARTALLNAIYAKAKVLADNAQGSANTANTSAATAQTTANTAKTTADKKVETYFSTTQPTATTVGDLWYNTSTSLLKRWNGSTWVTVSNGYTNTNQLTDGANLGGTATWNRVSGSGKPADNATVGATWGTNLNNQPTQLSNINSSEGTKLSGIAPGATVGATWGSNITGVPSNLTTLTGSEVINNAAAQDNLAKQMGYDSYSDLVSKAASSSYGTICVHGYLNTHLIDVAALIANTALVSDLTANTAFINNLKSNIINAGYINGLAINASSITTGTLSADRIGAKSIAFGKLVGNDITALGNVTAGSFNIGSGKFVVDSNGNLTATNASITGNITATTGKIGAWTIDNYGLVSTVLGAGGGTIKAGDDSTHFVNINDTGALISVRADGDTGIGVYTQDSTGIGISTIAQSGGTSIESYGKVYLISRSGEYTYINGRAQGVAMISGSCTIGDSSCTALINGQMFKPSLVLCSGNDDYTINLPSSPVTGEEYLIRKVSNGNITVYGNGHSIKDCNQGAGGSMRSSVRLQNAQLGYFVYEGSWWVYNEMN